MKSKTTTLCDRSENPISSIIKGRLTAKEFNKAYQNEGWSGDTISKDQIRYAFLKKAGAGYKVSSIEDLKSDIYTVMDW